MHDDNIIGRFFGKSTSFSDLYKSRDNNFNLIRMVAAVSVLISHSFALLTGDAINEPLFEWIGITPGYIAVDVFFITSGYLVTASLMRRKNTLDFVIARFMRIFPGLFVCTLLSVFLIGLYFTTLSPLHFITHEKTIIFVLKNSTLLGGITGDLPGVFKSLPMASAGVNGSLWTLPFEIKMYALLGLVCFPLLKVQKKFFRFNGDEIIKWILTFTAIFSLAIHLYIYHRDGISNNLYRLLAMFFIGSIFFVWRSRIFLNRSLFLIFLLTCVALTLDKYLFFIFYNCTLAYLIFWLAYIPNGLIRHYNNVGDYSYGVYIYMPFLFSSAFWLYFQKLK